MTAKLLTAMAAMLVLAGCAAPVSREAPVDERPVLREDPVASDSRAPVERSPSPVGEGYDTPRPLPDPRKQATRALYSGDRQAEAPVSPAVVALLGQARRQSRAGQHDQASASVERALQIEPQHAWLWHRLAQIRFDQGQLKEAADLASKSNALAGGNPKLRADNWHLIAKIRQRQGDASGARVATEAAKLLEDAR